MPSLTGFAICLPKTCKPMKSGRFVGCKQRPRTRKGYGDEKGDAWCFTAIERNTKLLLAWHLDKRTPEATLLFAEKLRRATRPARFQLTTDGFNCYPAALQEAFGRQLDYAQLIKVYGTSQEEGPAQRYSPATVIDTYSVVCCGSPDEDKICTSHAERSNRTIRMQIRRFTRLTDAHSKKWENHEAALGLFFAYYNYCRSHETLTKQTGSEDSPRRKTTPAMASGLTDHVWTVAELLQRVAASTQS